MTAHANHGEANSHSTWKPGSGVFRLKHLIVNSYLIADPGSSSWVLVDAGLCRFSAAAILRQAAKQFGRDNPPQAIVLTHGHFDHVGAIRPLLERWPAPVYAHRAELPFLTGIADYLPPEPRAGGGLMAWLAFLFPRKGIDLGHRVQALPEDGTIPGLPGWRHIHTPGHTAGHIALFREEDRLLIAGDAFVTVKQESFWAVLSQKQKVHAPPAYFTPDWASARASIQALAELDPRIAATGHGRPMSGSELRLQLRDLLRNFNRAVPRHGRYADSAHPVSAARPRPVPAV